MCDAPRPVPDVGVPTDTGKLTSCRWLFEAVEDVVQWMQDCAALRHGMSRHKAVREPVLRLNGIVLRLYSVDGFDSPCVLKQTT